MQSYARPRATNYIGKLFLYNKTVALRFWQCHTPLFFENLCLTTSSGAVFWHGYGIK